MWWRAEQTIAIDRALQLASDGRCQFLSVEGEAGQGKTAFLNHVAERATGFHQLSDEGHDSAEPLSLLRRWIDLPAGLSRNGAAFSAAQHLRNHVDSLNRSEPVLICVDDIGQIDSDSLEALSWLVRRAVGERLLVAASIATLGPPTPSVWRRLIIDTAPTRVKLTGLQLPEAEALAGTVRPGMSRELVDRLWRYTGGHPLHLRALLSEHDPDELQRNGSLLAPTDLTATLARRREALTAPVRDLLDALVVLGSDWSAVTVAAEMVDADDLEERIAALLLSGLILTRGGGANREARLTHAVVRSALYAAIDASTRRRLHGRAGTVVAGAGDRLRHRLAAVTRCDPGLAEEVEAHADRLRKRGSYAAAADFRLSASRISADPELSERRWLDAIFELFLAHDLDAVAVHLGRVDSATDEARRALILGAVLIGQRRWLEGRRLFESVHASAWERVDARTRSALGVLSSWARVVTGGQPEPEIDILDALRSDIPDEPGLAGYLTSAYAQARMAVTAMSEGWSLSEAGEIVTGPALSADRARLAWRGIFFALGGRLDEGIRDLTVVTQPGEAHGAGPGAELSQAVLGWAQWLRGDWSRAAINLGLAADRHVDAPHPLVSATIPLRRTVAGQDELAAQELRDARRSIAQAPWPAAVQAVGISAVVLARLGGQPTDLGRQLTELRHDLGTRASEVHGVTSPLWILHLCMLHVWNGEVEAATELVEYLRPGTGALTWRWGAQCWLRGLIAEAEDRIGLARQEMVAARRAGLRELPLHEVFLDEDFARVESRLGHGDSAIRLQTAAADRMAAVTGRHVDPLSGRSDLMMLTDRERDVAALLVEGLSYAQIASELYVSRSTVAFHLSNIYAKTATNSRHELVALYRRSG